MATVELVPSDPGQLSEYHALIAAAPGALDAIPGAVYICDADGWLVRFNSEAAELWGRTPRLDKVKERFCGSHRLYLIDGAPLPHGDCPMADAVQSGTATRNAEVVIERPDGTKITALVNIRALRDRDGRIQGAINCFQDISAHKALEEELVRKNNDLEDFFENSAIGLHIVGGDGTILRANRAELELLGYTAEEYIGRHISEFHADQPIIGDILRRLSCGDKLDRYPARLRAKDGSIRHVLITSNSRFEDGRFEGRTRGRTPASSRARIAEVMVSTARGRAEGVGRMVRSFRAGGRGLGATAGPTPRPAPSPPAIAAKPRIIGSSAVLQVAPERQGSHRSAYLPDGHVEGMW